MVGLTADVTAGLGFGAADGPGPCLDTGLAAFGKGLSLVGVLEYLALLLVAEAFEPCFFLFSNNK